MTALPHSPSNAFSAGSGALPVESPIIVITREGSTTAGTARFLVREKGQCLWSSAPTKAKALAALDVWLDPVFSGVQAYRTAEDTPPPEPPTELQEIKAALAEIRAGQLSQHAEVTADLSAIAEHLTGGATEQTPAPVTPAPTETVYERLAKEADDYWPEDLLGPRPDYTEQTGFSRDGKFTGLIEPLTSGNIDKVYAAQWCGVNLRGNAGGDWIGKTNQHEYIREVLAGGHKEFADACRDESVEPLLAYYLILDLSLDPLAGGFDTGRWKSKVSWYRGKSAADYIAKEISRLGNQPGGGPGQGGA